MNKRLNSILISILFILICISVYLLYLNSLQLTYNQIEKQFKGYLEEISNQKFTKEELIAYLEENKENQALIVNLNYKVEYSSYDKIDIGEHFYSSNFIKAKNNGIYEYTISGKPIRRTFISMINVEGRLNFFQLEFCLENYSSFLYSMLGIIALIFCFVLLIFFIIIKNVKEKSNQPFINLFNDIKNNDKSKNNYILGPLKYNQENFIKEFNLLMVENQQKSKSERNRFSTMNSFLEQISTGILIFDDNIDVVLINKSAQNLLELNCKDLFFKKDNYPEYFNKIKEIAINVKKSLESIKTDFVINDLIIEIEAQPYFSKYDPFNFEGIIILIRDVTKIKEMETILRDFVSNVSHELKTPLTIISGYAQALQRNNLDKNSTKKCIEEIIVETTKMDSLIQRLLSLSSIEKNTEEKFSQIIFPIEIIQKQIESIRLKAGKKNIFLYEVDFPKNKVKIKGEELLFGQLVSNILDNAIKYSDDNSGIFINCKIGDYFSFSVSDKGMGIPQEDIPKIFDRFYRVEKSRNSKIAGSGLGLAITKEIVKRMNGKIDVKSEIGKGSTFTFYFPIIE